MPEVLCELAARAFDCDDTGLDVDFDCGWRRSYVSDSWVLRTRGAGVAKTYHPRGSSAPLWSGCTAWWATVGGRVVLLLNSCFLKLQGVVRRITAVPSPKTGRDFINHQGIFLFFSLDV